MSSCKTQAPPSCYKHYVQCALQPFHFWPLICDHKVKKSLHHHHHLIYRTHRDFPVYFSVEIRGCFWVAAGLLQVYMSFWMYIKVKTLLPPCWKMVPNYSNTSSIESQLYTQYCLWMKCCVFVFLWTLLILKGVLFIEFSSSGCIV